jgi:hypothetical protein
MFALLRHIGHTCPYEIPPRPRALPARRNPDPPALQRYPADTRRHVLSFDKLLKSLYFGVLPAAGCGAALLLNEQAQQSLRALRDRPDLASALLVILAVVWAAVAR